MNAPDSPNGMPRHMKALRAHARGGPEQLTYEDAPTPTMPSGADVCVRVKAAAITLDELTWPETWEADGVDRTPIIPSHEFAGDVVALGPEVDRLSIGDAVFGLVPFDRNGAAAEYVVVPSAHVARKPSAVQYIEAAAAVLPALTASEALTQHAELAAGERLLIRGATGAVGSFLTQFASAMGVEVTATVRSADMVDRAERLGAHAVLVAEQSADVASATFDTAIDAVGAGTPEWLYRAVRPGGRVITLQEPPDAALADALGLKAIFFVVSPRAEDLERLAELLAAGTAEVAVAEVVPLADGRTAYAGRSRPVRPGKTVLVPPTA